MAEEPQGEAMQAQQVTTKEPQQGPAVPAVTKRTATSNYKEPKESRSG